MVNHPPLQEKRQPCDDSGGLSHSFISGLLSQCSSDLQVIRFNLEYLANLQNVQLYLERRLNSSSRSMAMAAVHLWNTPNCQEQIALQH